MSFTLMELGRNQLLLAFEKQIIFQPTSVRDEESIYLKTETGQMSEQGHWMSLGIGDPFDTKFSDTSAIPKLNYGNPNNNFCDKFLSNRMFRSKLQFEEKMYD